MLKKLLLLSAVCAVFIPVSFAANQATLHIVNETKTSKGWLSLAKIDVANKPYAIYSVGFSSSSQTEAFVNIPANEDVNFNLKDFIFGNGHLNPTNIDKSCQNISLNIKAGETKTISIIGKPTNDIGWSSGIFCIV